MPKIRYAALEKALTQVSHAAVSQNASVHMPRIGTGDAGGEWTMIEDLIQDTLIRRGVSVTVYDLPPKRRQFELF
jgi:hypothetical protein